MEAMWIALPFSLDGNENPIPNQLIKNNLTIKI